MCFDTAWKYGELFTGEVQYKYRNIRYVLTEIFKNSIHDFSNNFIQKQEGKLTSSWWGGEVQLKNITTNVHIEALGSC